METAIDSAFLRVRTNMSNPVHRKNVILLMIGKAIGLAMSVCISVGIVFGVAPAVRAARKDPIEAVRYE